MADKSKKSRGFAIFIAVMVILLLLAISLFVYGSMNNGVPQPRLPGSDLFAMRTMLRHG